MVGLGDVSFMKGMNIGEFIVYIFSPIGKGRRLRSGLPMPPKSLKSIEVSGVAGGSSPDLKAFYYLFRRS